MTFQHCRAKRSKIKVVPALVGVHDLMEARF